METFIKWCYEQGVIANDVEIKKSENTGYGIFTTNTIKDATKPYVFIPKKLLITAANLLTEVVVTHKEYELFLVTLKIIFNDNSIVDLKQTLQELKNEKLSLRLFLAYEVWKSRRVNDNQQQKRFWKPYFDVLPTFEFFKQHNVLFLQTDKTENPLFALLEGTSLASSIRAKQSRLKKEWEQLQQSVGDQLSWLKELALDDWFYIDALFWSRVVSLGSRNENNENNDGEDLALIPYFDFANHQMVPNLRWQLIEKENDDDDDDEKKNNYGLQLIPFINDEDDDDLMKKKDDNIILEKGQELCLSYGDKPNQELLFLHGFCLPDNPVSNLITLSFFPFLNPSMQDEESVFKWKWLQQQSTFKPILIIHYLSQQQQLQNSLSPTIELFKDTGFTFESICMMYLVVLDQDDGLIFEVEDENKDVTDKMQKLSLISTDTPVIQLYLNDDDDAKKDNITTMEQLYNKVLLLPHADVIQLRVVTLLMEAIQYHLQQIELNDLPLESNDNDDSNEQLNILKKSPLFLSIQIYRNEERETLQKSLNSLSNLSNSLMESEAVLEYLDYLNSMENNM